MEVVPFRPKSGVVIHTNDSEAQAAMAAGEAGEEREGSRDLQEIYQGGR